MENYWNRAQPLPRTGPLQLQTHGGEIRFRNLKVRRLDAATKRPAGPAATLAHFHGASRRLANIGVSKRGFGVAADRFVFPVQEITGNIWTFVTSPR
jgi:hypothetical protein